ncbi:hypothetical protein HAX54_031379 [Datura stramonium]|uniref:RING-type E3 ubiquitin transferase n=1 Tax=Datura stramonium TaxID=4076 RepID=A0ABS8VC04_DATST|nr:hypothetical protein [Datura stramonium]
MSQRINNEVREPRRTTARMSVNINNRTRYTNIGARRSILDQVDGGDNEEENHNEVWLARMSTVSSNNNASSTSTNIRALQSSLDQVDGDEEEEEENYNDIPYTYIRTHIPYTYVQTHTSFLDQVDGDEEEEGENYNEFLDHDMLEYLKTRTYHAPLTMDIGVNEGGDVVVEEQETCAICLLEYRDEVTIGTLQCGHEFHVECINKWLMWKKTCPFCRAEVVSIRDEVRI